MKEILLDALKDTLIIYPFLLIAYILIEVITFFCKSKMQKCLQSKGAPVFVSFFGMIPQCGFSVLSAELYNKRMITIGTLFAVFLATSDEALPILFSNSDGLKVVLPVLLIKLVVAILFGLIIDLIFRKRNQKMMAQDEQIVIKDYSCGCDHHHEEESVFERIFLHPFLHSLKIFAFIFVINLIFGIIVALVTEQKLIEFLQSSSIFAPLIAVLVGSIPNCASSVIISEIYILGGIDFASLVAGLCANVGIGAVVLFKDKTKIKESAIILLALMGMSVFVGYVIKLIALL